MVCGVMGHIGFEVARTASLNDYKVIGIYNKSITKEKIKILKKQNVKIIRNDLKSSESIKKIIKNNKIKGCIYAAAVSHEIYAKKDPNKTLNVNCFGVHNILSIVDKKFKFIYLSTGSVYQDIKNKKKINEDVTPTPFSIYSGTKRLGEIIVNFYRENFNKNCVSLRVSWVYGPPMICKKLNIQRGPIPIILYKYVKGARSFKFKSGKDFRASFTYIDDVTNAIFKLLKMNKYKSSTLNLGTGKNNSIKEIFKALQKDKKIQFKIGKGASPWSNSSVVRGPLISKNKDFKAKTSLNIGIKKYLNWLKLNA